MLLAAESSLLHRGPQSEPFVRKLFYRLSEAETIAEQLIVDLQAMLCLLCDWVSRAAPAHHGWVKGTPIVDTIDRSRLCAQELARVCGPIRKVGKMGSPQDQRAAARVDAFRRIEGLPWCRHQVIAPPFISLMTSSSSASSLRQRASTNSSWLSLR